jgi:gluconolactonase
VAVQNGRVTRFKADGSVDSVLVTSGKNNVTFNQANDLSYLSDGSFYFTDLNSKVFYLAADGTLKVAAEGLSGPNGVQVIEESGFVYVKENLGNKVTRFTRAADGTLSQKQPFVDMAGPDGGDVDAHGNWYIASYTEGNIRVFNAAGGFLGKISVTDVAFNGGAATGNTSNCAFGGPENKTLFITGDGGLYAVELKIPGRPRPGTTSLIPARTFLKGGKQISIQPRGVTGRIPWLFQNDPDRVGKLPVGLDR